MNKGDSRRRNVRGSAKLRKTGTGSTKDPSNNTEVRSLDGWRGNKPKLDLTEADLDLVDNVLCLIPELRAVARLGQEARRRGLRYPVTSAKHLVALLRRDSLDLDGHRVDAGSIIHALAKEWFPLAHEGELLSAIHLGIRRCEAEGAAAFLNELRSQREDRAPSNKRVTKE